MTHRFTFEIIDHKKQAFFCEHCGTKIRYGFVIENISSGMRIQVGRSCLLKIAEVQEDAAQRAEKAFQVENSRKTEIKWQLKQSGREVLPRIVEEEYRVLIAALIKARIRTAKDDSQRDQMEKLLERLEKEGALPAIECMAV